MYNFGLFAKWVPKPLHLLLLLIFLFPILIISGIYTGNLSNMVGSLGTDNSWMIFANHATTVGMGVSLPVILRYKLRFYTKYLMITVLLILAIASFMVGTTDSPVVIVACSFTIGFIKMFALMELMIPIMFILSPDGNRPRFYSIFYTLSLVFPQITTYIMVQTGFYTYWENVNLFMAAYMLVLVLLTIVFAHNKRFFKKVPLYYMDWMGMTLFAIGFLALAYILSFAKQLNYFRSDNIVFATYIMVTMFTLYVIRQNIIKRPYVNLKSLLQYNVLHGMLMIFMLGFFLAGGSLQTKITRGVLGFDAMLANTLNLWMIPGVLVAGIYSMKWLMANKSLKFYILSGLFSFMFYYMFMYFLVSSSLSYNMLILPNILRGFSLTVLFIGIWLYALDKLTFQATAGVAAVLVILRTMIGPGFFGIVFNYFDAIWNLEALTGMGGKMDAAAYTKLKAMQLYKSVNIEALMVSTKRLYGTILIFGSIILIYVFVLRFNTLNKRDIILIRKRLKGESIDNYSRKVDKALDEQAKTEITAASGSVV